MRIRERDVLNSHSWTFRLTSNLFFLFFCSLTGRSGCATTIPSKQASVQKTVKAPKSVGGGGVPNGHTTPLTQRNGTVILESATITKKKPSPPPPVDRKHLKNGGVNHNNNVNGAFVTPPPTTVVLQKTPIETKAKQKQDQVLLLAELNHANKTVEAFGTMIQYLVFNVSKFPVSGDSMAQKE